MPPALRPHRRQRPPSGPRCRHRRRSAGSRGHRPQGPRLLLGRIPRPAGRPIRGRHAARRRTAPAAGDADWEVVRTPGYTPGHLALWQPEERLLVVGDALSHYDVGWVNLALDGPDSAATALTSLKRIADLAPRVILPSHGPIPTDPGAAFATALRRARRLGAADATALTRGRVGGGTRSPASGPARQRVWRRTASRSWSMSSALWVKEVTKRTVPGSQRSWWKT
ncbi:MBL fold metallo-hydrolase [Streptomyces antimycoticus]|uniref:MBL fold metallo-hydrolase n=1 Tax=Streptomyces antimycoticus TaxID=68175 RepID=UPI0010F7217F|nr:MBL fold metallo-hydrolase [Streptomyces antimycoticus]